MAPPNVYCQQTAFNVDVLDSCPLLRERLVGGGGLTIGSEVSEITWGLISHWTGHGQHPNLKMDGDGLAILNYILWIHKSDAE